MLITYEKKISKGMSLKERRKFVKLSKTERRQKLAEHAEKFVKIYHLDSTQKERETWQGGDIFES